MKKFYKVFIYNIFCIDKTISFFILILLTYSIVLTWSASGKNLYIIKHKIIQIIIGLLVMIIMAKIPPRIYESFAPHFYFFCIFLLVLVIIFGHLSNGARRWLNFGFVQFQPSEITKISVPLMVSYFTNKNCYSLNLKDIIISFIIILVPVLLVAKQPDLGTALLIGISGLFVLFFSGTNWKLASLIITLLGIFISFSWFFLIHDYQKNRIIILLNPKSDPLRSGYHIIQSKIAIGSGGLSGKGLLMGTQSQLEFLPERHTDFIFAVLGEELGFLGIITLFFIYLIIIIRGFVIALKSDNFFGKIIVCTLVLTFFLYIFVNIGMVSGILPIVGIPLPLLSYGGSSLVTMMAKFGIIMSIHNHKKMLSKSL